MRRRDAKIPAKDEQLDLPFDRRPKTARTNGAEPLSVRVPEAVNGCASWRRNGVAVLAEFRALLSLRSPVSKRWHAIDPDRYFFEGSQSFDLYSQKCVI